MKRYTLTSGAEKDLIAIWNYTFDTWGESQADHYIEKIEASFANIAKRDSVFNRPLPSYPGVRSVHCEHHYIFFLNTDKPVIFAILHEKMDLLLRLKKFLSGD